MRAGCGRQSGAEMALLIPQGSTFGDSPSSGEGSGDTEKLASGSFRAGMMLLEE